MSGINSQPLWAQCSDCLKDELPTQQYNTWIRPLFAQSLGDVLQLVAPNRFIRDWVADKFLPRINELVSSYADGSVQEVIVEVADFNRQQPAFLQSEEASDSFVVQPSVASKDFSLVSGASLPDAVEADVRESEVHKSEVYESIESRSASAGFDQFDTLQAHVARAGIAANTARRVANAGDYAVASYNANPLAAIEGEYSSLSVAEQAVDSSDSKAPLHQHNLIEAYRFDNFVEGKSNQMARAAALQVVENAGGAYNPLFLYGGVGLGKTHLMHAVGNALREKNPRAKVVYLHSERFVADMVKALKLNAINDFKRFYRSVDALLIDDIQFFAKKDRSQEEFFHTFNALLEGGQQMILTCDRYPKEIDGVEERLKSRFGWGLTVAVEPPELETRVAILIKKAEQLSMSLSQEAAFFLAQRVRSNVRELEGALKRAIASAHFTKSPITVDLIKESLKDLLALQDKQVSIDNIQRSVAEYYKIKVADLNSKRRNRSIARPRQVAMSLAKELTNHSLPEIGDAFGGRDHTTVLHACRKVKELRETTSDISEDYKNLLRLLVT